MTYDSPVYQDEYGFWNYECEPCKSIAFSNTRESAEKLKHQHLVERHGYREMLIPPE